MVTIVDFKTFEKEDGENFFALVVQGGIEVVKSQTTGRNYITSRNATVPTTLSEMTCKSLIGTTLEGKVKKVECDPYDYTDKNGDIIELSHRYEYITDEAEILADNLTDKETVL